MLHIDSFEIDSLKSLNEKFKSYLDGSHKRDYTIESEYLLIDEQIDGLWIEISTPHTFTLSKSVSSNYSENRLLQIIYSNTFCQYQIGSSSPEKTKQGMSLIPYQKSYQLSFISPNESGLLLLSIPENWYQKNVDKNSQISEFERHWNPIYSYYFSEINKLKEENITAREFIKKSLLSQFFFQVMIDLVHPYSKLDGDSGVNKAKKYLISNLHLPFPSLKFLADVSCMSISQLKSKFRQSEQLAPEQFFINKRMEFALDYLRQGKSVKEITLLVGYSNSSNFINAFKAKYGKSPLQYNNDN